MLWIWSYPVSKKELFLKLVVPKKQVKFVKNSVFIAFAGSRAEFLFIYFINLYFMLVCT